MEAATPPPPPPAPPAPQPAGRQPISVGQVLSDAFSLYGANIGVLIGVGVVIYLISGILQGILGEPNEWYLSLIASIVSIIATAIYTGFVVKVVQDARDGIRDATVGDLVSAAMPAVGPLIIMSILFGIAVVIGFVLLIIPGLVLLTLWAVTAPSIVVEGRGPIEAFGRSYQLVKGQAWTVFGIIVCVFLILVVSYIIMGVIGGAIGGVIGFIIVAVIVQALFMPVYALVSSVLFFELGGGENAPAAAVEPGAAY